MIVQPRRSRPRRAALTLAATTAIWITIAGVSCSDTLISDATTAWPATTFSVGTALLLLAPGAWPALVQLPLRRTAATRHRSQHTGRPWWRHPALTYRAQQAGIVAVTLTGIAATLGLVRVQS